MSIGALSLDLRGRETKNTGYSVTVTGGIT